ncbi:ROK family protein [Solitalea sp. MAHUQ-68]|uniref:ROK family protein n=1 Tax=Solitalea agri TaxID=2953739 RepID=A0A9X2JDE2_9SPHI|nr:ROK family protein [Solitalea agri]MCO4293529.1 ROK family protein [Solitalea agri]
MERYLGIDVGGNHVKTGIVDNTGEIQDFKSFETAELRKNGQFVENLLDRIVYRLINHKDIQKIGIGLPGTITKDRSTPIEITAIPEINGTKLQSAFQKRFPGMDIFLENDANAAALGELHFAKKGIPNTYGFITLGTGIGSAAVIDRRIFTGGDGNGLELGHIPSRNNKTLEQNIGKQGIIDLIGERLATYSGPTKVSRTEPISATRTVVAATEGDEFARSVFYEVGEILGEGLVSFIRIMDIKTIIIGGGLSAAYQFIEPGIKKQLEHYLTPYYLKDLKLYLASLGNDAGLLGAASLCFD